MSDKQILNEDDNQILREEAVVRFLQNQTKELEIKKQQVELQKQEDEHGFEFSKLALDAKAKDLERQRNHNLRLRMYNYLLIGATMLLVGTIVIYAMHSGNKDVAMDIIKAIAFIAGGGIGGYGIAKTQVGRRPEEQKE